jgi:hypothetical protein
MAQLNQISQFQQVFWDLRIAKIITPNFIFILKIVVILDMRDKFCFVFYLNIY